MFIVGHQSLTQSAISRCNIHLFRLNLWKSLNLLLTQSFYSRINSRYMIICANIYIEEMLSDYINQTMFCMKFSVMHLGLTFARSLGYFFVGNYYFAFTSLRAYKHIVLMISKIFPNHRYSRTLMIKHRLPFQKKTRETIS